MTPKVKQRRSFRGGLAGSAFLVMAEFVIAVYAHLPLVPFAIGLVVFLATIVWLWTKSEKTALIAERSFTSIILLQFFAACVALTGGLTSALVGLFFLPVFLGALYFGVRGSITVCAGVCAFLFVLEFWRRDDAANALLLLSQCGVFFIVSLAAGGYVEQMERETRDAKSREHTQSERTNAIEWFIDTEVMMHSLDDLDQMISVAMLRLNQLLPEGASAAIFLREPESLEMILTQTSGFREDSVGKQALTQNEQTILKKMEFSPLFWTQNDSVQILGPFAELDSAANSAIVVALRTYDDLFGVLFVSTRQGKTPLTQEDSERLSEFARHIVYPIQRVRVQALATMDVLTGLANRRAFRQRLQSEVIRAKRYNHALSLVLIDIDYFKKANDQFGHRAGDALLSQLGALLRRVTRGIDIPARYGGEEMAILCPESTVEEAAALAERIRTTVAEMPFNLPDGAGQTHLTVSLGVAALQGEMGSDATLVEEADQYLYQAKEQGRNRVCIAANTRKTV